MQAGQQGVNYPMQAGLKSTAPMARYSKTSTVESLGSWNQL